MTNPASLTDSGLTGTVGVEGDSSQLPPFHASAGEKEVTAIMEDSPSASAAVAYDSAPLETLQHAQSATSSSTLTPAPVESFSPPVYVPTFSLQATVEVLSYLPFSTQVQSMPQANLSLYASAAANSPTVVEPSVAGVPFDASLPPDQPQVQTSSSDAGHTPSTSVPPTVAQVQDHSGMAMMVRCEHGQGQSQVDNMIELARLNGDLEKMNEELKMTIVRKDSKIEELEGTVESCRVCVSNHEKKTYKYKLYIQQLEEELQMEREFQY